MFTPYPLNEIIYFENGQCRHINNIIDVKQGRWFHILTKEGKEYIISPEKVLFIEVTKSKK